MDKDRVSPDAKEKPTSVNTLSDSEKILFPEKSPPLSRTISSDVSNYPRPSSKSSSSITLDTSIPKGFSPPLTPKPKILILTFCGPPASGKSSLCNYLKDNLRNLCSENNTNNNNNSNQKKKITSIELICWDDVRESIYKTDLQASGYEFESVSKQPSSSPPPSSPAIAPNPKTNRTPEELSLKALRIGRTSALSNLHSSLKRINSDNAGNAVHEIGGGDGSASSAEQLIHVILLDDTFHLRSMRKEVISVCREFMSDNTNDKLNPKQRQTPDPTITETKPPKPTASKTNDFSFVDIQTLFVYFRTPLPSCLRRNGKREGRALVSPASIAKIYGEFQIPGVGDCVPNFEEGCCLMFGGQVEEEDTFIEFEGFTKTLLDKLWIYPMLSELITIDTEPIVQPPIASDTIKSSSLKTIDLNLRKLVATTIKLNVRYAKSANLRKKEVLGLIKSGEVKWEVVVGWRALVECFCLGVGLGGEEVSSVLMRVENAS